MSKEIDIKFIKEKPELFFSQLPDKAQTEISEFLRYIIFKYDISLDFEKFNIKTDKSENLLKAFKSTRTGLPIDFKFNREEANER